jgi:PAS domain S-box-containing protein
MSDQGDRNDLEARRFRALASSTHDLITEIDERGRLTYRSPDRAAGGDRAEGTALDRVHPEDREEAIAAFSRLFQGEHQVRAVLRSLRDDGEARWLECTGTSYRTADGERRAIVLSRDISESRAIQARLRASRARFRLIAENAYDMIVELDARGRVVYANPRVSQVLGAASDSEWRGRDEARLVHPDDAEQLREAFEAALAGGELPPVTVRVTHRSGEWRWLETSQRGARPPDGEPRVVVIARDVTERFESERQLQESEQRYRGLVESSPFGILVVQGGVVAYSNAAGAEICGAASPAALLGTPMVDLVVPDQIPEVVERVRRAERGERGSKLLEVCLLGLDGQAREVIGSGSHILFHGAPAFQGVVSDVSALRRGERERRRLELQLQEARKLESLGLLAGGIAHDFNNLLAVILGNVRFAQRHASLDPELAEALGDVAEAGEQAARLTQQLLAYAGRRAPEVRSVDLSELVRASHALLRSAIPREALLQLELSREPVMVHADVVQLEQVLMNLVINAGEALRRGGTIRVVTGRMAVSAADTSRFVGAAPPETGEYAFLEVCDDGQGMDASTCERIFEPFFSTKQQGHGLGLAAVVGLVRGHAGGLQVRSRPGEGTRMRIVLPVLDEALTRGELPEDGSAAVLACADPDDRRAISAVLEARGIQVLTAEDAPGAHALLRLHRAEIGLAVCDGGGAEALAAALRGERPGLPLLLLGTADDEALRDLARSGPLERLADSREAGALEAALDALIDKPDAP